MCECGSPQLARTDGTECCVRTFDRFEALYGRRSTLDPRAGV
jgi:hypothetical protein